MSFQIYHLEAVSLLIVFSFTHYKSVVILAAILFLPETEFWLVIVFESTSLFSCDQLDHTFIIIFLSNLGVAIVFKVVYLLESC